jgi:hypothetical protein
VLRARSALTPSFPHPRRENPVLGTLSGMATARTKDRIDPKKKERFAELIGLRLTYPKACRTSRRER